MLKTLTALLIVGSAATIGAAATTKPLAMPRSWGKYSNDRFGFEICYPSFFVEGPAPDNDDGRRFTAKDGGKFTASASYDAMEWGLAGELRLHREGFHDRGIKLIHTSRGKSWGDLSGASPARQYYTRSIATKDTLMTFAIEYPRSRSAYYAPIVARMAKCFRGGLPTAF